MNLCLVVFTLNLYVATDAHGVKRDVAEASISGFGLEMILAKLDHLQDTVAQVESAMKQTDLKLSDDVSKLSQRMDEKLSALQTRTIESIDQKLNSTHDRMREEMQKLASKNDLAWFKIDSDSFYQNISIQSKILMT